MEGLNEAIHQIHNTIPFVNKNGQIEDFVKRNTRINIHAVACVCFSLKKQCKLTMKALEEFKDVDDKHSRRNLLLVSFKLAIFNDFLYSAI